MGKGNRELPGTRVHKGAIDTPDKKSRPSSETLSPVLVDSLTKRKLILKITSTEGTFSRDLEFEMAHGDEAIFGRTNDADVPLDSSEVSRRHARIYNVDGNIFVEDLGSTNKTWLSGKELKKPRQLATGDNIQIGNFLIDLNLPSPRNEKDTVPERKRIRLKTKTLRAALILSNGSDDDPSFSEESIILDEKLHTIEIGRMHGGPGKSNRSIQIDRDEEKGIISIALDDDMVSRKHATINLSEGGLHITDQGSMNGTIVESEKIQEPAELFERSFVKIVGTYSILVAELSIPGK